MSHSAAPRQARSAARPERRAASPLLSFLYREFGFTGPRPILDALREAASVAKWDSGPMIEHLDAVDFVGRKTRRFGASALLDYDANIVALSQRLRMTIGNDRPWMPHQYLALLFVERYLDRYFDDPDEFCRELNLWKRTPEWRGLPDYWDHDLRDFAIQSASGSGKTPLMYANILQYQHYLQRARGRLNNILVLTPGEGVSEHHEREARASRLRARRLDLTAPRDPYRTVWILDLHQFADEQVTVELFGENNLLVVDEGHTGVWGERWPQWRSGFVRRESFIIEYSAAFGPLARTREPPWQDYAKNLLFDYGLREFRADGYGKDFTISRLPRGMESVSRGW